MQYQDISIKDIRNLLPETASPLISLLDYWVTLKGKRPFPSHKEILPENLVPWLGRINLMDVLDPIDFRYRVYGSKLSNDTHYDLTGKCLSELSEIQRVVVYDAYCEVVKKGRPLFSMAIPKEPMREFYAYSRLMLPIGDHPEKVDMLMVLIQRLTREELDQQRENMPQYHWISLASGDHL